MVLADVTDNAGGGAPNDSTFILRRLLERNIDNAAVGCIWDPVASPWPWKWAKASNSTCVSAARWAPCRGTRGSAGTCGQDSAGRDTAVWRGHGSVGGFGGAACGGRTAGIDIVAISKRTQTFSPEVFTNVGIDPMAKKILVVKSTQHFYAGFDPMAAKVSTSTHRAPWCSTFPCCPTAR